MATVAFNNSTSVYPVLFDSTLFSQMEVVGHNANTVTLENAYARITLTASTSAPFSYTGSIDRPSTGTVDSAVIKVFTSSGSATTLASLSDVNLLATTLFSTNGFVFDNLFSQSDTFTGTAGADYVRGYNGNDTIVGNGGNDTLDGGSGADSMSGGGGNDVYVVDNASDKVVEGAGQGIDTVALHQGVNYVLPDNVENLDVAPPWISPSSYGYYNTTLTGNDLGNIIRGGTAGENIAGMGGADRLFGGDGNDTLDGGAGTDTLVGGNGDDTYRVDTPTGDKIIESSSSAGSGQPGVDTVIFASTKAGQTFVLGDNLENLRLDGSANINGTGNALDNVIVANSGKNVMKGLAGNDTVSFETATAKVTVNLGVTSAQATGGSGSDKIIGFENVIGGSAGDVLKGTAAANRIDGGGGNDTMTGLAGDDTYVVDSAKDKVVEATNKGTDHVFATVDHTLAANVENLTLQGYGLTGTGNGLRNLIEGDDGNNLLMGKAGDDTLIGGVYYSGGVSYPYGYGDDTLDGGTGADSMNGGAGSDTYLVDNPGDVVTDASDYYGTDVDTVVSSIAYKLGQYLENLELTGTANINGAGNAEDNVIMGNAGNNVLNGGRGVDTVSYANASGAVAVNIGLTTSQNTGFGTDLLRNFENVIGGAANDKLTGNSGDNVLDGGAGKDTLIGGKGDDTYIVDHPGDVVTEAADAGNDAVQSSVTYTLPGTVENLTLTGPYATNVDGTGNTLANYLMGSEGANLLKGLGGNDTLDGGGSGLDTLNGGAGDDTYIVHSVTDVVLDSGGMDTVVFMSPYYYQTYNLADGVEDLIMATDGASATGNGNALDNHITGDDYFYPYSSSGDTLNGMGGDDTLNGMSGSDNLTGGPGKDVFVFDTPLTQSYYGAWFSSGVDTITDFDPGVDKIALDDDIFTTLPTQLNGSLPAGIFREGTAAVDANDMLIYDQSTGALYYDPDGTGAQEQTQFAILSSHPTGLSIGDFTLI